MGKRVHGLGVGILTALIPFWVLFLLCSGANAQWVSIVPPDVSPSWGLASGRVFGQGVGWAVGTDAANKRGAILQFRAHAWRVFDPPNVSPDWELNAVGLSQGNDVWAVGVDYSNGSRSGIILRNLNGLWTVFPTPFVSVDWALYGLSFSGSSEGWAVGFDYANKKGVLLRYKTGVWTYLVPPDVSDDWGLYGVHMINSREGWAVGVDHTNKRGVLLRFAKDPDDQNRTKRLIWQVYLPPPLEGDWELRSVWFPGTTYGIAVGVNHTEKRGVILQFLTPRWDEVIPPPLSSDFEFNFVSFPTTTLGWISGTDHANKKGVLLQYNNKVWINSPLPEISSDWMLGNVRFTASDQIWAFGTDVANKRGVILRYSVNTKETVSAPSEPNGPTHIAPDTLSTFYTGESLSNIDHSVQYFFDWGDGTNSGWLPVGTVGASKQWTSPGTYPVKAQARCDTDTNITSKLSSELSVVVSVSGAETPIKLLSPPAETTFTACSLYALPTFTWNAEGSFTDYTIQFSKNASMDIIVASDKVSTTSVTLDFNTWKKVLLAPGNKATNSATPLAAGGPVFWRVVGTRSDKTLVNSDTLPLQIETPQPVGNPAISDTSKSSLPTLSWDNNCNIQSRAWFGNNPYFTHKTSITFNVKDPTANGGAFAETLTSSQWTAVQNVTGRVTGSVVYWYVESWDGTNRRVVTQPNMSFVISD